VADLMYPHELPDKLRSVVDYHNFVLKNWLKSDEVDYRKVLDEALEFGDYVKPMIDDVSTTLHDLRRDGANILYEGAQGSLLDIDHGTYPFVTSSNTTVGGAYAGTGVGASDIDYVLGICKAYATRVGGGPFPTELNDATGEALRKRGNEFGATTGRPRRCGWMDIVALKRAVAINGISGLCITKLDILDGMETLKICIAYEYRGKRTEYAPLDSAGWEDCKPVYLEFPGWQESTAGITEWDKLPPAARAYLRALEELAGCPLAIVSTGPDRDANIVLRDPFA
jgi:adenylosuccinate synthase